MDAICRQLDAQTQEHGLIGLPGKHMSYCNDGFGLLSEIVRRVSGATTITDYVQKNLLEPLGIYASAEGTNATLELKLDDGQLTMLRNGTPAAFTMIGEDRGIIRDTLPDSMVRLFRAEGKGSSPSIPVTDSSPGPTPPEDTPSIRSDSLPRLPSPHVFGLSHSS